ncbi:hypothetical protein CMV_024911 [Castanea mollissima]|uniref:Uncharacterized protein n=1 Tax=Castanea mollissima TaxID=60419 RepID=A0A8J4QMX6_9ROSI|nr:hypothetical protein CMV_024911 [Castanea mollissima]
MLGGYTPPFQETPRTVESEPDNRYEDQFCTYRVGEELDEPGVEADTVRGSQPDVGVSRSVNGLAWSSGHRHMWCGFDGDADGFTAVVVEMGWVHCDGGGDGLGLWVGFGNVGSENEGFGSVEDGFESASGVPDGGTVEKAIGRGDNDVPFVGYSEFSMFDKVSVASVAKASTEDDDENGVVGSEKVGVLGGTGVR